MPGRYYITKQVGKGPVSELFLALDATDKSGKGTEFHLMRFRAEFCAKQGFVDSLEAEAAVEVTISHDNILKLVDYGTWEGRCFLVYEKNSALSLAEALNVTRAGGKAIDYLHVAGIALQLLDALIYAHTLGEQTGGSKKPAFQSGFSPESVELSGTGQVKVRGFTRAPAKNAGSRPNFLDMAMGRMPYLAPPIWAGERPSAYTDLYSLGALLWELLVGQPLAEGKGTSDGAPPVFSLRPDLPRELDAFVAKLLVADADAGFKSATEARAMLDKALFTLNAKADKKRVAAWHRLMKQSDPKAGMKEDGGGGGERKVLAEVVASRKLALLDSSPQEVAEAPAPIPAAAAPKETSAASNAWDKSVTFKEAPDTTQEDLAEKKAKKTKLIARVAAGVFLLALLGVGGLYYSMYLEENPAGAPVLANSREMLAVFAHEQGGAITVQGVRNDNLRSFAHGCGEVGEPCICEFLLGPEDAEATASVEGAYSAKFNLVRCPENSGTEKFVRIASKGERAKKSNAVLIRNSLTWRQALGPDLMKARVRWVSQFTCDRNFVEGEGVSPDGKLSCKPLQKIGTISGVFHYHSYRSDEDGDKAEPVPVATDAACGQPSISSYRCLDENRTPIFGLYKKDEPPFSIPISLTHTPLGQSPISIYGFAAEPDSGGLCPAGLIKLRQWTASPHTMDGSTFVNTAGELNDRVFESLEPKPLELLRRKNRSPCDGKGDCAFATLEDPAHAHSVPYSSSADICVFPVSLIGAPMGGDEKGAGEIKERAQLASVQVTTTIPEYEVYLDGTKVEAKNNTFPATYNEEHKVEIRKSGYKTQRFTIPPQERGSLAYQIDAPAVQVQIGTVDLASFPPSTATFYAGEDMVFTGPTPVTEKLPVGKYRVKMVDKLGNENEISVTVIEGKTISVDHLMKNK